MKEAARGGFDLHLLADAGDFEPVERLDRAVRLALGRAERGEVMTSDEVRGAFAQNTKKLNRYKDALDQGRPPIERGFERSRDDEIRRGVIQSLMCNFHLDIPAVERAHGIDFAAYFADSLRALDEGPAANGFVVRTPSAIEVTEPGRLFVRNVCMEFDAYLKGREGEKPIFSRTV